MLRLKRGGGLLLLVETQFSVNTFTVNTDWWYFITADLRNERHKHNLQPLVVPRVVLYMVSNDFFPSQELPYIKLLF